MSELNANVAPPQINPDLVRMAQHYAQLAGQGKIIGMVAIGIAPDGNIYHGQAMPQVGSIVQLAIGALDVLISDLADVIRKQRQTAATPKIIRPNFVG